jgi:hypothetical protein
LTQLRNSPNHKTPTYTPLPLLHQRYILINMQHVQTNECRSD